MGDAEEKSMDGGKSHNKYMECCVEVLNVKPAKILVNAEENGPDNVESHSEDAEYAEDIEQEE